MRDLSVKDITPKGRLCNPSVIRQRRLPAPFDKGAYWARITCHRGAMDSMPSHGDGLHTAFRQITYRSGGFKIVGIGLGMPRGARIVLRWEVINPFRF